MRTKLFLVALCSIALVAVAWAGSGEKCTYETQACLNHMAQMGQHGWLGVDGKMVEQGYKVTKIYDDTPAVKAGLKKGDILVAINGATKNDENFMKVYTEAMQPGNTVNFTYKRGEEKKEFKATLVKMPEDVYHAMVGTHMLDHAKVETASREK